MAISDCLHMCSKDVAATADQSKTAIALAELGKHIRVKTFARSSYSAHSNAAESAIWSDLIKS